MAKFKPYVLRSRDLIATDYLVVAETFCGVVALWRPLVMPGVTFGVQTQVILEWEKRYTPSNSSLQYVLATIKESMSLHGGTPEAVRLLHELEPLTKKELLMAKEKLAGKAKESKAAPAEKADKKVAKAASPTSKKGNPEALAKAREAQQERASALKAQKIKALVKWKDISGTIREGTFRAQMVEDLLASKTVGEFYEKGTERDLKYDASCVRFAEEKEYISLG